jgi:hypothetical protein
MTHVTAAQKFFEAWARPSTKACQAAGYAGDPTWRRIENGRSRLQQVPAAWATRRQGWRRLLVSALVSRVRRLTDLREAIASAV